MPTIRCRKASAGISNIATAPGPENTNSDATSADFLDRPRKMAHGVEAVEHLHRLPGTLGHHLQAGPTRFSVQWMRMSGIN